MPSIKNTNFLEAVAAAIQHEKDFFDFCLKTYEELPDGAVKNFFFDLAEDSEYHLKMIEGIYQKYAGGGLPNLKHLGQVHKFHATAIQKLIRKLDRNLKKSAQGNELEALRLALQEAEDAAQAFAKLAEKFDDTGIKMLFRQMSNFNKERAVLLEGTLVFQHPLTDESAVQDYHLEVVSVRVEPAQGSAAPRPQKKAAPIKPKKKVASGKKAAKKKASKNAKKKTGKRKK